ncbi:hypothetical protein V6235_05105 [Vibrio metschnikovii]|uniref:hypothetical protein n=1 Tax=Vibrio metschnikovii TaxID=28172 RepID=UPI002FE62E5A
MNEKSIAMRIKWLNPKNSKMTKWLRGYAIKHSWINEFVRSRPLGIKGIEQLSDLDFCEQFIQSWSAKRTIDDEDKHRLNLIRSAWSSYSKKEKNVTLSLSNDAQKSLFSLSKTFKKSKNEIVNTLLLQATELKRMQKLLKDSLNSMEDNYRYRKNQEYLNAFFDHNELIYRLEKLEEENEQLKIELEEKNREDR